VDPQTGRCDSVTGRLGFRDESGNQSQSGESDTSQWTHRRAELIQVWGVSDEGHAGNWDGSREMRDGSARTRASRGLIV
jgi:hypothetical protein